MDRFAALLVESGVGLPRGVLGPRARAFAAAVADGAGPDELDGLRRAASAEHWDELRLAVGAALERAVGDSPDPRVAQALEAVADPDPTSPFALAVADEAARALAAVLVRTSERLVVLERRLADAAPADAELALVIGAIVVDLLDLDPADYESEIEAYVRAGEGDGARRDLVRQTGDTESREWAREELREVGDPGAPVASRAVAALASGPAPEDPADDAVWIAAMLALVEQAVEIAIVSDGGSG
jgi:hypothetical protein